MDKHRRKCGLGLNEKEIALMKYMDLRIKGFGLGLSKEECHILQTLPKDLDDALLTAIIELGGSLPEGLETPKELSEESRMMKKVFKGMWCHGHDWAVKKVVEEFAKENKDFQKTS